MRTCGGHDFVDDVSAAAAAAAADNGDDVATSSIGIEEIRFPTGGGLDAIRYIEGAGEPEVCDTIVLGIGTLDDVGS
jgi:hypothetical protein